jgi:phosphocarrier protein FPr
MTVGLVIVSHSLQLAAGIVELAGQMTQGKTPMAAAGGTAGGALGTSVDKILAAIQAVDSPDGVLVLLDLGSAVLSAEMAVEFLNDDQRARTHLSYAPLVEGAMAAAIEASLGRTLPEVRGAAEKTAQEAQLQQLKPLSNVVMQAEQVLSSTDVPLDIATQTVSAQLLLKNPTGLHARPASLFVQTAARFQAQIQAMARGRQADATSIMALLSLGARHGDAITLQAQGADARAAIEALSQLVGTGFYETTGQAQGVVPMGTSAEWHGGQAQGAVPTEGFVGGYGGQAQGRVPTEESWGGVTMSSGVAVGPAYLYGAGGLVLSDVEPLSITAEQVPSEQKRLRDALKITAQELTTLATQVQDSIGQAEAAIFEAQALMLNDPSLLDDALHRIEKQHVDAASALAFVGEQQASQMAKIENELIAVRAVDVRDAVGRAVYHLRDQGQNVRRQDLSTLDHRVILVARDLTPSDVTLLRPAVILGICTIQGGPIAHAAILARALGIPALAGLPEAALLTIRSGDELGLDADSGLLYHHPTAEICTQLSQHFDEQQRQRTARKTDEDESRPYATQQAQAPIMIGERRLRLLANIASEAEAEAACEWGAEGVGLLRTEFLFATAATLPDEHEQRQRYAQVFRAFKGEYQAGPIVVRTLDAGADKPMPVLGSLLGSRQEANPALGLRGIRIHLAHQELLEQQLRALLLAAADTDVQLHIMFPMITTVEELRTARTIFDRVYQHLQQQKVAVPSHVRVGIMVEVPAAAIMAPELAELADFFSIGTNDLLQYTLACDRTSAAVSHLYHPMQPAMLRLIRQVAEAGRKAGRPVAVCGEMACDVRLAPVLVALGVDELSMTPGAIPTVRAAITRKSAQELADLAERLQDLKTVAEVEQICENLQD